MASDKALRTRQSIIEAANALVASEGISALTMDNVAKKAGLSKGACTYHFKSKRELQTALLENYVITLMSSSINMKNYLRVSLLILYFPVISSGLEVSI